MKKSIKILLLAMLATIVAIAFAACGGKYADIAGTYEMTSISGKISGVNLSPSYYEYYRIILDADGNATVQAKGSGTGGIIYEAKGTFTYEDGEIKLTSKNGGISVTETMAYEDGVITYELVNAQMDIRIVLERADKAE